MIWTHRQNWRPLNTHIHITQENNKVVGYENNKTVKLIRLERSMREAMSTFQSVVEVEHQNVGP